MLKKVTGKSDGDVDDVVTKKGEVKEKNKKIIADFVVPCSADGREGCCPFSFLHPQKFC